MGIGQGARSQAARLLRFPVGLRISRTTPQHREPSPLTPFFYMMIPGV